jgi:UDP-N-acetylglucosamine 2-epimerase (non-hydrolysing)
MIISVVGARPNFIKMAPVVHEINRRGVPQLFVHTGQHYDAAMSKVFFDDLHMPHPDVYLGVGSGSHAEQTARVMTGFERVLLKQKAELVIVAGDVNSTLACALVAAKLAIPVAHLEAGLRSFDRTMPEEINRVLTDHVADILLTSEPAGEKHLRDEGIDPAKIHFVGNCMIDSLVTHRDAAVAREPWKEFGLQQGTYALVTLHRPALVDDPARLDAFGKALSTIAASLPVLFPVHPRTRKNIEQEPGSWKGVRLVDPLGYLDFLGLMARSRLVLTDSGGIQEETTALGVSCITVRENTERPVTVDVGTNRLAGLDPERMVALAMDDLAEKGRKGSLPEKWDGKAAHRAVDVIERWRR